MDEGKGFPALTGRLGWYWFLADTADESFSNLCLSNSLYLHLCIFDTLFEKPQDEVSGAHQVETDYKQSMVAKIRLLVVIWDT